MLSGRNEVLVQPTGRGVQEINHQPQQLSLAIAARQRLQHARGVAHVVGRQWPMNSRLEPASLMSSMRREGQKGQDLAPPR